MMSFSESFVARLLAWLAHAVRAYPRRLGYPQLILFILSIFYTAHSLKLNMNRGDLIGAGTRFRQVQLQFKKEFPEADDLVVVVESGDIEKNRDFIERLARRVQGETNLLTDVFYKADFTTLGPKALFLAPESDLAKLQQSLRNYKPFISDLSQIKNLDALFEWVNHQFLFAPRQRNVQTESLMDLIPFLQGLVDKATQSLQRPGVPAAPEIETLFAGGEHGAEQMYVTYDKGGVFVLTARARTNALNPRAIQKIRELIAETQAEVAGLNVGLTGEPVLDYDEMLQSEHDSFVASIVALVLCSLIFVIAYREIGRPLKAALCLIVGLAYSLGFATLAVGNLNILSVTFAPMLIGLAIDFGVHFTTRFEEERRNGRSGKEASDKAMIFTGQGIVTGAMTTAGAFLAMALTHFKGVREMGLISGGGLLLCLVPMLTILPMLLLRDRREEKFTAASQRRVRIENLWLKRPWVVVVITAAACLGAASQVHKVYFDYDLLHMQSKGLASVKFEQKLLDAAGRSFLFASIMADSPKQALEYEAKLKKLPSVLSVQSVADLVSGDQEKKLRIVREIKQDLSDVHFVPLDPHRIDLDKLNATLWYLTGYLGLAADEAGRSDRALGQKLLKLRESIMELRVLVLSGQPQIQSQLMAFQSVLLGDLRWMFEALQNQDTREPLGPSDLPPSIHDRFIGVTGKYLIQVYPKKDAWEHENQREFIDQLKTVVPEDRMSGTPIQLFAYTTLLKNSYQQAAYYALAAVAIMIYLHFRSVLCVLLSLLPVAIGTIWLVGCMGIAGIPFNPANIMTLPLVIGIGVTNGIQILNRFAEEQQPSILAKSTGKSVFVSGLTAIAGFGSLLLAKHQGIKSLGLVMSVGIAGCLIAGLVFFPSLLMILRARGWTVKVRKKRPESPAREKQSDVT